MTDDTTYDAVELATELTVAWLSNPNTRASGDDVPAFLRAMHEAVAGLATDSVPAATQGAAEHSYEPAVSVRKSLASKDHIISLIDGKPYKTLRRHLNGHGLTPDDYRARYGLKPDYPMVAESYSTARRDMAHKIGLGRKSDQKASEGEAKQATGSRRSAADAKKAAQDHLGGNADGE